MTTHLVAAAPATDTLSIELVDGIATLTSSVPSSSNAMSVQMLEELPQATGWLAAQADLRALVITGAGRGFSTGADVDAMRELLELTGGNMVAHSRHLAGRYHAAILDLRQMACPVIAAINGLAAGAGLSLALACDLRIASDRAALAIAYGSLGSSPDGGMTYFLPRIVGPARTLELMLEDRVIRAARALEEGLVTRVVEHDDLLGAARKAARMLAATAPHYVRTVKRLVEVGPHVTLAEHLDLERHAFAEGTGTADFAARILN